MLPISIEGKERYEGDMKEADNMLGRREYETGIPELVEGIGKLTEIMTWILTKNKKWVKYATVITMLIVTSIIAGKVLRER